MTTTAPAAPPHPRTGPGRVVDRAVGRLLGLPPPTTGYTVTRDLRVPMRDGVQLLTDHYAPTGTRHGTVLVRVPYGRSGLMPLVFARPYAERGFSVLLQSCRGTYGSGGQFRPAFDEADDGADTVAWLRAQPWFDGRLVLLGGSYPGFAEWALMSQPPPELAAAVVAAGPHDDARVQHGSGALALNESLTFSVAVAEQEVAGIRGAVLRASMGHRLARAFAGLPLVDAAERVLNGRAPWHRERMSRRDVDDPFWSGARMGRALDLVEAPVLLIGGWQDPFLDQTLEQYARLSARGVDVALTIGPWMHLELLVRGLGVITRESLEWLTRHLAGAVPRARRAPVRLLVTGAGEWRDLPGWPPPSAPRVLHLQPGGGLADHPPPADAAPSRFTYDPADPTPTVGGRMIAPRGGYRDDRRLARRGDVLAFTGPVLTEPLEVVGVPVAEIWHGTDNPHADLFVRLGQLDGRGRSRNVSEGFVRLDPAASRGAVRVRLDACAHRFAAGTRIRVLVVGGSHPRFARNLGTGDDPATGVRTTPSHRTVAHGTGGTSRVILPVPTR